jgi:hypothetical protein
LPPSIEQVAAILGITLSREQQLVAANDKGFIPAMLDMGATDEEIARIRKLDRQSQGVTANDEELAEQSINNHLSRDGVITIVKSLTPKFSPITDRLFGKADKLVVYNNQKLVYYGQGAAKLNSHFLHLAEEGATYYGGGENGYWGIKEGVLSVTEITEHLLPQLLKTLAR